MAAEKTTATELAAMLNGREYGNEVTREEARLAKESGLVIVYGYSDDCAELKGAINDEASCFDGGGFYVTKNSLMTGPDCGNDRCDFYKAALKDAKLITAVWCDPEAKASWSYKTEIPHETFNIYEDGELFCIGMVFSAEDV